MRGLTTTEESILLHMTSHQGKIPRRPMVNDRRYAIWRQWGASSQSELSPTWRQWRITSTGREALRLHRIAKTIAA